MMDGFQFSVVDDDDDDDDDNNDLTPVPDLQSSVTRLLVMVSHTLPKSVVENTPSMVNNLEKQLCRKTFGSIGPAKTRIGP